MPLPNLPSIDTAEWTAYSVQRLRSRTNRQIAELARQAPPRPYRPPAEVAPPPVATAPAPAGAPPAPSAPVAPRGGPLPEDLVPNQLRSGEPLSTAEAMAACGPAAAVAFARSQGRNPTLREAVDLAKTVGWTETQGMAGPQSQKQLLDKMGIASRVEQGVDWAKVRADVEGGNPVAISTPKHYFVATGYNADNDTFNFQESGAVLKGGGRWLKPAQVQALGNGIQASIFVDNPDPATAPSIATVDPGFTAPSGFMGAQPNVDPGFAAPPGFLGANPTIDPGFLRRAPGFRTAEIPPEGLPPGRFQTAEIPPQGLPPGQFMTADIPKGPPTEDEITAYVKAAATARGIDPDVAVRAAHTEGGVKEPARRGTFATGSSWWPFQLHYGGRGTEFEKFGTTAGMGNSFTRETGWEPGDPNAWRASVDYALDGVARNGWGAWYGPKKIGITGKTGVSPEARPLGVDPANLPGAEPTPAPPAAVGVPSPPAATGAAPAWMARAEAQIAELEGRYGGLLPQAAPVRSRAPTPLTPAPNFLDIANAQVAQTMGAREARRAAAAEAAAAAVPAPAPAPVAPPVEPEPLVETPPYRGPMTGDADLGIGLGPAPLPEVAYRGPTGDADLGIGLEPGPEPVELPPAPMAAPPPPPPPVAPPQPLYPPTPPPVPVEEAPPPLYGQGELRAAPEPNPFEKVGRALVDALKGVPDLAGGAASALGTEITTPGTTPNAVARAVNPGSFRTPEENAARLAQVEQEVTAATPVEYALGAAFQGPGSPMDAPMVNIAGETTGRIGREIGERLPLVGGEAAAGIGQVVGEAAFPLPGAGLAIAPGRAATVGAERAATRAAAAAARAAPATRAVPEAVAQAAPAVARAVPEPGAGVAATAKGERIIRQDLIDALQSAIVSKTQAGQVEDFIARVAPDYAAQQTEAGRIETLLAGITRASEEAFPVPTGPPVAPGSGAAAGLRAQQAQIPPAVARAAPVTREAENLLARVDAGGVPMAVTNNLRRIANENGIPVMPTTTPNDIIASLRARVTPPARPDIEQLRRDLATIVRATPEERAAFAERARGGPEIPEALRVESAPGPVGAAPARAEALGYPEPLAATEDLASTLEASLRARGIDPAMIAPQRVPAGVLGGLGGASGAGENVDENDDQRALKIMAAVGLGVAGGALLGPQLGKALRPALANNRAVRAIRESTDAINLLPTNAQTAVRTLRNGLDVVDTLAADAAKTATAEARAAGFTEPEAVEYGKSVLNATRAALVDDVKADLLRTLVGADEVAARLAKGEAVRQGWVKGDGIGDLYAGHQVAPEAAFILRKLEAEKPDAVELAVAGWKNALLTGPPGRIRDVLSTAWSLGAAPVERLGSAAIDVPWTAARRAGQALRGRPVTAERQTFFGEAPALVQGYAAALPEAFDNMMKMLRYGYAATPVRQDVQRASTEILPGALNLPGRLVGATDVYSKALSGTGSVYAQAVNSAKREGKRGQDYIDRVAYLREHPTATMLGRADLDAKYRAFQEDSVLSDWISAGKEKLPILNLPVAFHSTAIAMGKQFIERSPLGVATLLGRSTPGAAKYFGGPTTQREATEALARVGMGSAAMYMAHNLAETDLITGPLPQSVAERDAWVRQGRQPYSIKIGGEWRSYQGWPMSAQLAAGVAIRDAIRAGKQDDALALWTGAALAGAQALADPTWTNGLEQLSDLIAAPTEQKAERYAESWARSLVPQAIQTFARASDRILRDPNNPIEAAMAVTPGLSQFVAPRLGAFGAPQERPEAQLGIGAFNPFRSSAPTTDPVEIELARLQEKGLKVQPGLVGTQITAGPGEVELTTGERARYQEASGKIAYGLIAQLMASPQWDQMKDPERARSINAMVDAARKQTRGQMLPETLPRGQAQFEAERAAGRK